MSPYDSTEGYDYDKVEHYRDFAKQIMQAYSTSKMNERDKTFLDDPTWLTRFKDKLKTYQKTLELDGVPTTVLEADIEMIVNSLNEVMKESNY